MLNRIKTRLKALPKVYWIYIAILFVAEIIAFSRRPDTPGLYTHVLQILPLVVTLPFLIFKNIRKNFKRTLFAFAIICEFSFI